MAGFGLSGSDQHHRRNKPRDIGRGEGGNKARAGLAGTYAYD